MTALEKLAAAQAALQAAQAEAAEAAKAELDQAKAQWEAALARAQAAGLQVAPPQPTQAEENGKPRQRSTTNVPIFVQTRRMRAAQGKADGNANFLKSRPGTILHEMDWVICEFAGTYNLAQICAETLKRCQAKGIKYDGTIKGNHLRDLVCAGVIEPPPNGQVRHKVGAKSDVSANPALYEGKGDLVCFTDYGIQIAVDRGGLILADNEEQDADCGDPEEAQPTESTTESQPE